MQSFLLKIVTAKWYTEECHSNVLKQVEKHQRLNELLVYRHTNNVIFREGQGIKLMDHPAYSPDFRP